MKRYSKLLIILLFTLCPFVVLAQSAQDYYKSATIKLIEKRYEESIADYSKAIKLKSDYVDAYFNRGIAYEKIGEGDKAVKDYAKVIKIKPSLSEAYINRALLYKRSEKYQLAISDLSRAIELRPDYAFAYLYRADSYYSIDSLDQAVTDYKHVLIKLPNYLKAHKRIAEIYLQQLKYPEALTHASKLCELDSSEPLNFILRADIFIALGRKVPACKDLEKALSLGSDDAKALINQNCTE